MSDSSKQFHKIWIDQCEATEGIRERFGLDDALHYLIGEKLFSFVRAAEDAPDFAAELPAFVAEIRRIFSGEEIRDFLNQLERTKFLAPDEPEANDFDDLDDSDKEEVWLPNPILAAEELNAIRPHSPTPSGIAWRNRKDPVHENISDEVIVDAYGPEGQAMGWYYYLDNKIRFPFRAKCIATKTASLFVFLPQHLQRRACPSAVLHAALPSSERSALAAFPLRAARETISSPVPIIQIRQRPTAESRSLGRGVSNRRPYCG